MHLSYFLVSWDLSSQPPPPFPHFLNTGRGRERILHGEFNSAELHCIYVRFEALSHALIALPVASSTVSAQP